MRIRCYPGPLSEGENPTPVRFHVGTNLTPVAEPKPKADQNRRMGMIYTTFNIVCLMTVGKRTLPQQGACQALHVSIIK